MTTPRRALILVDVQREYFSGPLHIQHPDVDDALNAILVAIDAAHAAEVPVAVIQHVMGEGAPVFDPTQPGYELHPEIERRRTPQWKHVVKRHASVFAGTDLMVWLKDQRVNTVTFAGFMTNNCVLASTVYTEELELHAEILSDATGAINLANSAGAVDAETVHTTLLTLLNSNWATVVPTSAWATALTDGAALEGSDLVSSAIDGTENARC